MQIMIKIKWGLWLIALIFQVLNAKTPPNILFISVDDMRDWINFLGGYEGEVFTPHMDRLAERGVNFINAHCPSPVCNPSRTAVMTGLMPSTTGIYNNGQWLRPNHPEMMTMPQFFKENGYMVVRAGKSFHHTAGNNPPDQWHAYMPNPWSDFPWARSNKLNYPWTQWEVAPEGYPFSKLEYLRAVAMNATGESYPNRSRITTT